MRSGTDDSWWDDGHTSFLTNYTLCDDVMETFAAMVTLRDELAASGRMFAEDLKSVRGGDGLTLQLATGRPDLRGGADELPLLGHGGLVVLRSRRPAPGGRYADEDHELLARALLSDAGGAALLSYASAINAGSGLHVLLLEDAVAARAKAVAGALEQAGTDLFSQAAYAAIEPHNFSWADDLRAAGLPHI